MIFSNRWIAGQILELAYQLKSGTELYRGVYLDKNRTDDGMKTHRDLIAELRKNLERTIQQFVGLQRWNNFEYVEVPFQSPSNNVDLGCTDYSIQDNGHFERVLFSVIYSFFQGSRKVYV